MMMSRSSKMAVAVAAMTHLAVVRGACTYEHEDLSLDFSGLTKTGNDGYYQVNSTQYTSYIFLFNICGPIIWQDYASPNVCPSGQTGSCEVQLVGNEKLVSENYGFSSNNAITHQNGENGQPAGPVITMNASECGRLQDGTNIQTKIYLVCDESATTPIAEIIKDSYWECYMHATLRTNLACGGGRAYPDANYSVEEEAGDDVGMLLCVFFFVGFALYFGIGATLLHRKGERGFDRVPQKEFWSSLPGLIGDGISFSKNMIQSKIQGGGSGGGYDNI